MQYNMQLANSMTPMTTYEKLAITLSFIAIIIPIVQWAWKKWVQKAILRYYGPSKINLYFNKSGSYLRVDGSFEAINKAVSIKKVDVKINRVQDNAELNLEWATFISPVTQSIVGAYASQTETAHPIRIWADSIMCAFIEFCAKSNSAWRKISPRYEKLQHYLGQFSINEVPYDEVLEKAQKSSEFADTRTTLEKEFYWDIGDYTLELSAEVSNKRKPFRYSYKFSVNEQAYATLYANIDELLLSTIKSRYNIPISIRFTEVDLQPTENNI